MRRVVVGVDGSEHARRAVEVAAEEARLRGAVLAVVHAIAEPSLLIDPVILRPLPDEELRAEGLALIEGALEGIEIGDLRTERIAEVGGAAGVLCDAAGDADLLVVGSRGLGGFRGLLVGSVAQQVVTHAPCPVLVVVPPHR